MALSEREIRNLIQNKQDKIQVKTGTIGLSDLVEGVPVLNYIPGLGLYWVTKYNNEKYYFKFTKGEPS